MPARGPYAKGEAKRAEIVEVAFQVFTESGYDRASVREIARRAGLSQAALLHYFRTKEELFVEVLRRRDEANDRFYDETETHDVTIEGLLEIIAHNSHEPGLVRLYAAMSAESTEATSTSRQFFTERYEKLRNDLAADISRKQEAGELTAEVDAADAATLLIAVADGLQIQWLLKPDGIDMAARLRQLNRLLQS
ncbi:TetR/AcrR family transcriptional regulator [Microbacterium sp. B2969]|uniref:TetR/AcrR family transcriptional regulator n=1 Tax=Microbacterium alkaliflavum TaxID=3248839 RepID=A0ABW7Q2H3_9MICO